MALDQSVRLVERTIAAKLLDLGLAKGYSVSVYDGEEWTLNKSKDRAAIIEAMATTDDDRLAFFDGESGLRIGWVWLIYGNEEDLISDYTDSETMDALVSEVNKELGL